jgi:hypothetical protein
MKHSTCTACGRTVLLARTTAGRKIELDYMPLDKFAVASLPLAGAYWLHWIQEDLPRARMLGPASSEKEMAYTRYRSHTHTCPGTRYQRFEQPSLFEEVLTA